ncbi:hypothetical protein ACFOGJ_16270 [Marinibaculum pumilum]|uniref:Uncharacterized protein n=1 Tax=Marinibaculum pumilum TaxID=1766165 RepID=A0ABV7L380_9PROT
MYTLDLDAPWHMRYAFRQAHELGLLEYDASRMAYRITPKGEAVRDVTFFPHWEFPEHTDGGVAAHCVGFLCLDDLPLRPV